MRRKRQGFEEYMSGRPEPLDRMEWLLLRLGWLLSRDSAAKGPDEEQGAMVWMRDRIGVALIRLGLHLVSDKTFAQLLSLLRHLRKS